MDEATIRPIVAAHAEAVCDPIDIAHVQADMIEELHPGLTQLAVLLPQPVRSATVDELEVHDDHVLALITYRGDDGKSLSVRSRWEDRGGDQPQIVQAAPAA